MEVDKQTDEINLLLQTFDDEVKQRLKLEDLGNDGHKPDPLQWADLLDVDPDFREESFRVYQSDEIKDAAEEPSPEISDVQFLNMELELPRDGEGPELRDEDGSPVASQRQFDIRHKGIRIGSTSMAIRRRCRQTQSQNACLPKWTMRLAVCCCLTR
jgi:hypothetical protein